MNKIIEDTTLVVCRPGIVRPLPFVSGRARRSNRVMEPYRIRMIGIIPVIYQAPDGVECCCITQADAFGTVPAFAFMIGLTEYTSCEIAVSQDGWWRTGWGRVVWDRDAYQEFSLTQGDAQGYHRLIAEWLRGKGC